MDEINNLKRLLNLSDEERRELEKNAEKFVDLAKKLIQSYDQFENEKVKAGRLKTLLDNVIYKVNFSYNELFKTSTEINNELSSHKKGKMKIGENLLREIEEFISNNSKKKEL